MRVLMVCPELPTADTPGSMAPGARQIESIRELGVDVDVVDMRGIPKLKYLQLLPRIRKLLKRADVVHAHFGYCGWLARIANVTRLGRTPMVMSFMGDDLLGTPVNEQGDLEPLSRWMVACNKRLATRVDRIIVKSPEMADVLAPLACSVIPNGVDVGVFEPRDRTASCAEMGLNPAKRHVLFPGNPENPRKGFGLAKEATQIASKRMQAELNLVPLWNIAPDQVSVMMNACDAMLMTSLIEGSPNVVKEAMACNLPVAGVPVGDVHAMLEGVAGNIACSRDPSELGEALSQLLGDESSSGGREAILARGLDLTSVAERIMEEYRQALGSSDFAGNLASITPETTH